MNKIFKVFKGFLVIGVKFIFQKNKFSIGKNTSVKIDKSVKIKNTIIILADNSQIFIDDGTVLENVSIYVKGSLHIGKNNFINNKDKFNRKQYNNLRLYVNGKCNIGSFNRVRADISVRFKAFLSIGDNTNINSGSEIRSDEYVKIGSFNQISYNVMIWDTDTHNMYVAEKRREITVKTFPSFGYEVEKPKTKPVFIGDDCWLGKDVYILKGCKLEDKSIIGTGTKIINLTVPNNSTVISKDTIIIKNNNI